MSKEKDCSECYPDDCDKCKEKQLQAEVERLKKENKELKEYSKKQDELAERLLAEKKRINELTTDWFNRGLIFDSQKAEFDEFKARQKK